MLRKKKPKQVVEIPVLPQEQIVRAGKPFDADDDDALSFEAAILETPLEPAEVAERLGEQHFQKIQQHVEQIIQQKMQAAMIQASQEASQEIRSYLRKTLPEMLKQVAEREGGF